MVAGEPADFQVEADLDSLKIDHVWITIRAGRFGSLRISISTYSLKHATDGFDPRMRVGFRGRSCRRAAFFLRPGWITPRWNARSRSFIEKRSGRP